MTRTPIEEKIQLLLDKAASTNSPHEAEALQSAAEKLMVKHSITETMLDSRADRNTREKVITIYIPFTGIYAEAARNAAYSVAKAMGPVNGYLSMRYNRETLKRENTLAIVAHEKLAKQVESLLLSLQLQAAVAVRSFWKEHPHRKYFSSMEGFKERRQFIMSFYSGAASRIRENMNQEVKETTGAELVLVGRQQEVDESMPRLQKSRSQGMQGGTSYAYGQGHAAGRAAGGGERGLTGGRGISA